jgi:hypothetical protein
MFGTFSETTFGSWREQEEMEKGRTAATDRKGAASERPAPKRITDRVEAMAI